MAGSTVLSVPEPDSHSHSRAACHRGVCNIDSPRATTSPESMSSTTPRALSARHPAGASVAPSAVPYRGRPSTIPKPFRWDRSDGSSSDTNGGRHRGVKLADRSRVQRYENRVSTTHRSPPASEASPRPWMSPVKWHEWAR